MRLLRAVIIFQKAAESIQLSSRFRTKFRNEVKLEVTQYQPKNIKHLQTPYSIHRQSDSADTVLKTPEGTKLKKSS